MPRGLISISLSLLVVTAYIVLAAAPAPRLLQAAAALEIAPRPDNDLVADALLDLLQPAPAYLEYGNDRVGWLRTPLLPTSDRHVSPLVRLRPETKYEVRAFVVGPSGCTTAVAAAVFSTHELPLELRGYRVEIEGTSSSPLALMDWRVPPRNSGPRDVEHRWIVALDRAGQVVWYYANPRPVRAPNTALAFAGLPNGNWMSLLYDDELEELSPDARSVRRFPRASLAGARPHHDLLPLPDGRVLFLSHDDRPPAEAPPQGSEDRRLRGDALYSLDPATGAASKLWSTFDLLDPTDRPPNTRDPLEDGIDDWTHANSLSFGPRRNLIISLRQLDQVISLSPDLSRVEWRLGGPGSSFTFTDSDDRFYRQHSATELPGWRLLVFDNGRNRPEGEFSRALELELDVPTMTARKVWEYRHIPDVYASRMSSALRLGNGGTLVNFGWRTEPDEPALLVEAGQDGGVISSQWLWMKGARTSRYRALAIDSLAGEIEVSPTTSTGC